MEQYLDKGKDKIDGSSYSYSRNGPFDTKFTSVPAYGEKTVVTETISQHNDGTLHGYRTTQVAVQEGIDPKENIYNQKAVEIKGEIKVIDSENRELQKRCSELSSLNQELEKKIRNLQRVEEKQLRETEDLSRKIANVEDDVMKASETVSDSDRLHETHTHTTRTTDAVSHDHYKVPNNNSKVPHNHYKQPPIDRSSKKIVKNKKDPETNSCKCVIF